MDSTRTESGDGGSGSAISTGTASTTTPTVTSSSTGATSGTSSTSSSGPAGTTTAESLADQQAEQGWGPSQCAAPPEGVVVGYKKGDQLPDLKLKDCEGNELSLAEVCGAQAVWLFFAHAWCPHCKQSSSLAEEIHAKYAGQGLATVHVLVEDANHDKPDAADCQAWRETYGHDKVLTLHDPIGASFALWEQSYTALNVFLDADRVITNKTHTDSQSTIELSIKAALP